MVCALILMLNVEAGCIGPCTACLAALSAVMKLWTSSMGLLPNTLGSNLIWNMLWWPLASELCAMTLKLTYKNTCSFNCNWPRLKRIGFAVLTSENTSMTLAWWLMWRKCFSKSLLPISGNHGSWNWWKRLIALSILARRAMAYISKSIQFTLTSLIKSIHQK